MELNVGDLLNKNWISIKKVGLPELEEVDKYVHKSKNVLIQTKCGDMFVAHCEKRFYYGGNLKSVEKYIVFMVQESWLIMLVM